MPDRCPSCDAPLATMADIRPDDTPRPEDDLLCWRAFHGECQREPVDWRARALAAESELAASRLATVGLCARLETLDAEHTVLVKSWHGAAKLADRVMEFGHSVGLLADEKIAARDRAIDACAERIAGLLARLDVIATLADRLDAIRDSHRSRGQMWDALRSVSLDLRALISDEKAVAGKGENAQSGTEGGE